MATIIQLTETNGVTSNKLYLNADIIRFFHRKGDDTEIYLIDQDYAIDVTESAEAVMRLINN